MNRETNMMMQMAAMVHYWSCLTLAVSAMKMLATANAGPTPTELTHSLNLEKEDWVRAFA